MRVGTHAQVRDRGPGPAHVLRPGSISSQTNRSLNWRMMASWSYWTGEEVSASAGAVGGALLQEPALREVVGERCGTLELQAGLGGPAELSQEVPAHGREQVVRAERWLIGEAVDQVQGGRGAVRHPDGDGAVELDDRRWHELGERVVERHDARPIGLRRGRGPRVACGDRGLQRGWPHRASQILRAL